MKHHPIFQEANIWQRELINRAVVAPMSRVSATANGMATDEMRDYYTAFATGGFGVILTEGIYTDVYSSKSYNNQPGLSNAAQTTSWKKLTLSVHQSSSSLLFAQLMHGGSLSQYSEETLAPSAVQPVGVKMISYGGVGNFPLPKAMNLEDIQRMQQGFINAAINAHKAGFDGVEIHSANGYLLDQFLTPELNRRNDQYGGTMQNRFRVIAEIITGIRASVPPEFIIGIRISEGKVNDLTYRWADGIATAKELAEEIKVSRPDFIHVAVQTGEWERDSFYGSGVSLASVIREITNIPVIANGGFHDLDKAKRALNAGHADLLAIGRAALADPCWPIKAMNNLPLIPFHQDMIWPEATISHTQKIIKTVNAEKKMKISQIKITPDTYESFRLAQGHRVGDLLFISGQTALADDGLLVGIGDFDTQAEKTFENLEKVLKAGGSGLGNVVKVTIMLRDMGNFKKVVALRGKYFTPPYPADTIFEVSSLFSPDALIEIEAIAVVDEAADWKN